MARPLGPIWIDFQVLGKELSTEETACTLVMLFQNVWEVLMQEKGPENQRIGATVNMTGPVFLSRKKAGFSSAKQECYILDVKGLAPSNNRKTYETSLSASLELNMKGLEDLKEKYQTVLRLVEEESRKDPEEAPYTSKYKAKGILLEMEDAVTKERDLVESTNPDHVRCNALLAIIYYQIGVISVDTEEMSTGEEYLTKAYDTISDHLDSKFVVCSINVRNQLGILWCQRSDAEKAKTWLEGAEKLYEDFSGKGESENAATFTEILDGESGGQGAKELEKLHTLTKFYLAQVYGTLKDLLKSAIYCHVTLRRQLVYDEYHPVDWSLNCATLSQFFMERILFKQARHHLAAASHVLDKFEKSLESLEPSEDLESKKEEIRHRSADVSRCWAKYGIFLLEYSKTNLNVPEGEREREAENESLKNLWFTSLDLSRYENEIMDCELVLYEDARQAFLVAQKHLNKAKEYYTLECHASDHVQIVQDHSQLFKHLTAYENDEDKQCKMIKRRIDLLQGVLKELNPRYYLQFCRQLWFELGESYHDVMLIKFDRMKASGGMPTPHALKKINFLAEQSIENFNHFLDSVKDKSTKELPEELEEDLIKPTLIAHFYLGRLYYKMVTADKVKKAENINKSHASFKYLIDYCEKSEYATSILSEELSVSEEMMSLLQMVLLQI